MELYYHEEWEHDDYIFKLNKVIFNTRKEYENHMASEQLNGWFLYRLTYHSRNGEHVEYIWRKEKMNKTEKLEQTITDLQQALEKAQKELEEVKKEKVWPQKGDRVFCLYGYSVIDEIEWEDSHYDREFLSMNNIFRTKEEAEHYRDWLKNPVTQARYKLQKFADEYNGDWKIDTHSDKWYFVYRSKRLYIVGCSYPSTTTYLKDRQGCDKAIEVLGKDLIKLACGVTE